MLGSSYALLLADTVKISSGVALPVLLTDFDKEYKDISYEMDDEEEESLPAKREKTSAAAASTDRSGTKAVLKTKLRSEEMVRSLNSFCFGFYDTY